MEKNKLKSIAFFNNKGGVGKTTLLCNLAASLASKYNKRVLVIDADPQCNASAYLLPELELEKILMDDDHYSVDSFYEPIRRGHGYPEKVPSVIRSQRFNVDLIVGDPKLSIREDLIAIDWGATRNGEPRGFQTTYAFKELVCRFDDYDYVLIDMGPSLGALNRSVLLAADYFLMPLSVDIFSMMAVENIIKSLTKWKTALEDATSRYLIEEGEAFKIANHPVGWELTFAGYVVQQYRAKKKEGVRQAVGAFERIIEKQKAELRQLDQFFQLPEGYTDLGEVPTLASVIPLSQQAHAPIFELGSKDGVVGAQYTRVSEASEFFHNIAGKLIERVEK
ncbi:ParA family protein [Vibrio cholerae]|uniref:ParA family protein n=1 Tax=Vibrio cholerae TaxID=666 RepID=UPI0002734D2A|nr:AAA family ATPase [Vibrio cholerae]EJH53010.1 cobQ/CobB/MinD/ParA nucleotide binding domain protein [Vibrio cholerae HC-43B1]MCR9707022.1 AAA family ATPase [Vibrio cholerae]MCU4202081.1 AAA family ATPase [Vibrio cholerae]MCU4205780.1 AAA family ATPase [Vibrio cholerae]MDW4532959.1 AAA family ATPase [Vibrio cholerae]